MDKEYAIKYVEDYGAINLLKQLISNGDVELAMQIIEDCWCAEDDTVIDDIQATWNF